MLFGSSWFPSGSDSEFCGASNKLHTTTGSPCRPGIKTCWNDHYQRAFRAIERGEYDFGEDALNGLGYSLLADEKIDEAIKTFRLNADVFPDPPTSGTAWPRRTWRPDGSSWRGSTIRGRWS